MRIGNRNNRVVSEETANKMKMDKKYTIYIYKKL